LIPVLSVAPERLFSSAKFTIIDYRNKLGIVAINTLMCLKSWFKILDIEEAVLNLEVKIQELKRDTAANEADLDTILIREVEALERVIGVPELD
jgi:hypothetical protein